MQQLSTEQVCRTCAQGAPDVEFYAVGSECKGCRRTRSRKNRQAQARKIAAFERFVDVLIHLADRSTEAPAQKERAS